MSLSGRLDEHLRQIEHRLNIQISNRGNIFHLSGEKASLELAKNLIHQLYAQTETDEDLTPAKIHLALQQCLQKEEKPIQPQSTDKSNQNVPNTNDLSIKIRKQVIKPQGKHQKTYVNNIFTHDIIFGIGPAGTGKTYLAVACAVQALEAEKVQKIVLVRPAVEAGERLGFLPGDLSQKIDPYLRPLYDALHEMLGFERVNKLLERNVIELAPLAYMRGRTLNDAFIILDESQNTTREQMKMFLTRLGFGSTAVITGDVTQIDLPNGMASGLIHASKVLKDIPGMNFTFLIPLMWLDILSSKKLSMLMIFMKMLILQEQENHDHH